MRRRMIFKFGLTVIVVVAVCLFYVIHHHSDDIVHKPHSQNDDSVGNQSDETHEISEEEKLHQAELERCLLLSECLFYDWFIVINCN
jgi:hypothetical protein